jgi:hypothetical protein
VIAIALVAILVAAAEAPGARAASRSVRLTIVTLPKIPGIRFALDGRTFVTGDSGRVQIRTSSGTHLLQALDRSVRRPEARSRFMRWGDGRYTTTRLLTITDNTVLDAGYAQSVPVDFRFTDRKGHPVIGRVTAMTISNSLGGELTFNPAQRQWLPATNLTRLPSGLAENPVRYSIRKVLVGGSNVVHEAQQYFYPDQIRSRRYTAKLLLYSARVKVRDFLLGTSAGHRLDLVYPNGRREGYKLKGGTLNLSSLPRGTYEINVHGGGYVPSVSLALSRDQHLQIKVVSYLDMFLFLLMAFTVIVLLALVARPYLRLRIRSVGSGRVPTPDDLEPIKPLPDDRKDLIVRYMEPSDAPPQPARGVQPLPDRSIPAIAAQTAETGPRLWKLPQRVLGGAADRVDRFQDSWRRILERQPLLKSRDEAPPEALSGERIQLVHVYMSETTPPLPPVSNESNVAPPAETVRAQEEESTAPAAGEPRVTSTPSEAAEPAEAQVAPKPKRVRTAGKKRTTKPATAKKATPAKQTTNQAQSAKAKRTTTKTKGQAKKTATPAATQASNPEPKTTPTAKRKPKASPTSATESDSANGRHLAELEPDLTVALQEDVRPARAETPKKERRKSGANARR